MNGLKITVPVTVSNPNLPILYPERGMNKGSLIGYMAGRYNPANLNNNTYVPNFARETAAAMVGGSTDAELLPRITRGAGFTGNVGLAEFTGKGGIHLAISQVNHADISSQIFAGYIPQKIKDYIKANETTHQFYLSTWRRSTRGAVTGVDFAYSNLLMTNTGQYLTIERIQNPGAGDSRLRPTAGAMVLGNYATSQDSGNLNPNFKDVAVSGPNPTTSVAANSSTIFAQGGGLIAFGSGTILNKLPSYITYRYHLVDLTVAGKTYAQMHAEELAYFNECFASGGIFDADTFTNPSTLP